MIKSIKKISKKHYIQCGLAVLLTGIILYFTSSLWSYKNIVVSFNTKLSKDIQYQVFYTEASGQSFNGDQLVRKDVKSGTQRVEIVLPIEKIVRFRLDIDQNPGRVEISDLQIKGSGKIKFDYNEFNKNQIDSYEVKGDKVILSSSQSDPYLWYKKDLDITSGLRVDWCRLIIISVLAFLLMYKFVQYLSRFKIEKHHSRIDIVMLAVFFALLFVPMSHISDAEKSEQENRMLAKKPQLTTGEGNYGVQFDAWYNDRFFGRDAMMGLYNEIKYAVAPMSGNDKVLVGKDGWLFYKLDNGMNNYANNTVLPEHVLENSLKYLTDIDNWCKKHNKEFYVFIAPDKSKIYGENYRLIKKQRSDNYSLGYQMYNYIRKNSDVKIIYPYDELIKHKNKGYLYYKQDTHWNALGAYVGYEALIRAMNMKPFDVKFTFQRNSGGLHKMHPAVADDDTEYSIFDNNYRKHCNYNMGETKEIICKYPENTKRLYLIRDSFSDWLGQLIVPHFKKSYIERDYVFSKNNLDFIKDNVDVVIMETVERYVRRFDQKFPIKFKND